MIFHSIKLEGAYVIEPERKEDERGYFAKTFYTEECGRAGIDFNILQVAASMNKKTGTLRGMHFQKGPKTEAKMVQCIQGAIYDVAVDLRVNSPTYCQWHAEELTEENGKIFLIPKGFAHGFQTLRDATLVQYFISELYFPEYARGVRWNDPKLKIIWPQTSTIISEQDKDWPLML